MGYYYDADGNNIKYICDFYTYWCELDTRWLYLIEVEWRTYASVNVADIGSDTGLSAVQHKPIN